MPALTLVIGNRNYSSWSLRAWLAARQAHAEIETVLVPLGRPDSDELKLERSPSGRVPVLLHGDLVIWDSLAISEYLHELHPDRGLWPAERDARAVARAVTCEMHAGFLDLRRELPMNVRRRVPSHSCSEAAKLDVQRIIALWADCRTRFGREGPYLFGSWSLADATYAPVVTRFRTYGVPLEGAVREYADAVLERPELQEWEAAAAEEPWTIEELEVDAG